MNVPSKHKKLIKAWANGATIRGRYDDECKWNVYGQPGQENPPAWRNDYEYEVVPAPVQHNELASTTFIFRVYQDEETGKIELVRTTGIAKVHGGYLSEIVVEVDRKSGKLIGASSTERPK